MGLDNENIPKLVKDGYNDIADTFKILIDEALENLEIFKKFISLIEYERKILDLGCGPASVSDFFFENNFKYTGIDLSEKQIDLARSTFPGEKNRFIVQKC